LKQNSKYKVSGRTFFWMTGFIASFMSQTFAAHKFVSQSCLSDSLPGKKFSLLAAPIVFYTPDTRWSLGLVGVSGFTWGAGNPSTKKSNINLGLSFTQRKQILLHMPFQIFSPGSKFWLNGEFGFFRYVYYFYGIGNRQENNYENYDADLFRIRINGLKKIGNHHFLGLRYIYDHYDFTRFKEGGELIEGSVRGSRDGSVSGLGLSFNYDSRDNIYYPSKGLFTESQLIAADRLLGSDFNYAALYLSATRIWSVHPRLILAVNTVQHFTVGQVPFHQLPFLGTAAFLRGYILGRFRDNMMSLVQAELRFPLFWRFKAVVFGGIGAVYDPGEPFKADFFRPNAGAGLRFLAVKDQNLHITLDYGIGYRSSGVYIKALEAF
jgi:outer membrane protein assembly factor BamA